MKITKDDFDNWWNAPVAREFKIMLKEDMDKLAYGNMTNSYCRDAIANAIEVGRFERTREIAQLTYEDLI